MSKDKRLPDFLVIGAGKSGTTSINNYLAQHPQIFMSPVKEPNFFAYETIDGDTLRHDPAQYEYYLQSVTTLEAYQALFTAVQKNQIIGETSNTYLYTPAAAQRIKHHIPNAKLIAILRNPADRLYSRFLHLAKYDQAPTQDFSQVFDRNSIWWERPDLIHEGCYYTHLTNYYNLFEGRCIKVFLYEELKENLQLVLSKILEFLGVDHKFLPDTRVTYNKSGIVKNPMYNRILGPDGVVQKIVKNLLPSSQYELLKKNSFIYRTLDAFRDANLHKPVLEKEIKSKLLNEVYYNEIQKLQFLIDRDLSSWLKA